MRRVFFGPRLATYAPPGIFDLRCGGSGRRASIWFRNARPLWGCPAGTVVDVRAARDWAQRLVDDPELAGRCQGFEWCPGAMRLLPGWYDDWVVFERELLRHWLLHALEAASHYLSRHECYSQALNAALIAVGADPLRESAQRALIIAYIAQGQLVEARRAHQSYTRLLLKECGVQPSPEFAALAR